MSLISKSFSRVFATALFLGALSFGCLALAGCSNNDNGSNGGTTTEQGTTEGAGTEQTQDNCYGDDLPVINS